MASNSPQIACHPPARAQSSLIMSGMALLALTASLPSSDPHYRTSAKEFTFASFVTRPLLSSRE